ncbi:MAG TPA: hypothetical protein VKZ63_09950, partial [Kofleriaceae bacterium]|nr:hypothetical protein [Kofleriaceae bacterium]
VADLPARVDSFVEETTRDFGNVVFVLTEFQLVDQATAEDNERGENSHEAYKARQHRSVRERLMRGREVRTERGRRAREAALRRSAARPRPRSKKTAR